MWNTYGIILDKGRRIILLNFAVKKLFKFNFYHAPNVISSCYVVLYDKVKATWLVITKYRRNHALSISKYKAVLVLFLLYATPTKHVCISLYIRYFSSV